MSYRKRDSKVEKEISSFLDTYFYPKIVNNFNRYSSKEDQLSGKDVSFSYMRLNKLVVDEKAATHYINKNIRTFAFELSFLLKNGNEVEGWLIDDNKETEYYLLMWINAKSPWNLNKDDIAEINATLVSRKKILDFLNSISYDKEKLKRANRKIRLNRIDGAIGKQKNSEIYFYSSTKYLESPINILIRKRKLESLALKNFKITKETIVEY
ncbi:MAG: hypothetical protein CMP55_01375 [Flavobacteriales bacterium]|nr:hypothetical protein [Flavobacteriales bacterium]|tara:strand:+ start:2064 stop:2696 length:633 start_codon:yes stop_codon:yes gene_type:complete